MMGKAVVFAICIIGSFAVARQCRAAAMDTVDFESGFVRLQPVSSVSTGNNRLHFSVSNTGSTFIANVGNPKDAFEAIINQVMSFDVPVGGNAGNFFLTDGVVGENDFLFDFDVPVSEFGLDLYDFVGDGGARPTDFVTLIAYSDQARTNQVASEMFTVPTPRPLDGMSLTMSVAAPSIAALTLSFSTFDRGTGLDNIRFVTIPEPSAVWLLAIGAVILAARARRFGPIRR